MRKVLALCAGMACVAMGMAVTWADEAATTPATAPAATEATSQSSPIAATDKDAIEAAFGKEVTVTGKVSRATWISTGSICFINFAGNQRGDFVVIVKKASREAVDKGFDGDVAKAVDGKQLQVTGKITKYNETPQLEVMKPEQITIVAEAATVPAK